ncbi:helix-turn-helix domain-containing protein [Brevibacterium album]|uniref:helix-turn-helix domain-containing protein n=1 Tax=Brevibacterium album TaxID=417948 RepID=UPI0003FBFDEB|nr:AraC family transcriptional regulator [Brevibacterium album]
MAEKGRDPAASPFHLAPRGLAPGVSTMVGYRSAPAPAAVHRGLPSARLTFILALDEGVEAGATEAEAASARPNPLLLAGLHTVASHVRREHAQAGIQLAVHPLAARALFGMPASALPLSGFDGAAVLGGWAAELQERLAEESLTQEELVREKREREGLGGPRGRSGTDGPREESTRKRTVREHPGQGIVPRERGADAERSRWTGLFGETARALVRQHGRNDTVSSRLRPELLQAWQLLERSGGAVSVSELASATGLSTRRLGTLFAQEVGHSPKQIAGLMRFERATRIIARQVAGAGRADLAGAATLAGYSDQAHLSREFARYSGLPPRSWIAEEFRNIQDGGHGAAAH